MNNTKIEWADATWNPVTGCFHGCEYCYARRIAERFRGSFGVDGIHDLNEPLRNMWRDKDTGELGVGRIEPYPYGFAPTFHRYRLDIPAHWKKPRTVFVCSMGDLFGRWVPRKWVKEVFEACKAAPRHKYLFLTKNPKAYWDMAMDGIGIMQNGDGFWYGYTATTQDDVDRIAPLTLPASFRYFLSAEPLHGPINLRRFYGLPDWVIIGAETGSRARKYAPDKAWVTGITDFCQVRGIPVYMKNSLIPVVGEDGMLKQFPEALEMTHSISEEGAAIHGRER